MRKRHFQNKVWKRAAVLLLTLAMLISLVIPVSASIVYGDMGHIDWSTHGTLFGHYAANEGYSRGLLCLEPEKGAENWDDTYAMNGSGSDQRIARIAYLAETYAAAGTAGQMAAWAVATGMVYDIVEGRSGFGTVTEMISGGAVSLSTALTIRDNMVNAYQNYDALPSQMKKTESAATEAPILLQKNSSGNYEVSLSDGCFNTDVLYHGFTELSGTSGTLTLGGANVSWSRNGGTVTFTITASELSKWTDKRSPAVKLTKRIGNSSRDFYGIWESAYEHEQKMADVVTAEAAHPSGYLAFYAKEEPGYAYFTKTIAGNRQLTDVCPQYYSTDGTKITVYDEATDQQAAVLTVTNGKTETIQLKAGRYYAKETQASTGFAKSSKTITFEVKEGQTFTAEFSNEPLFDPMGFTLTKDGLVKGEKKPLSGAEFTVSYYTDVVSSLSALRGKNPYRTWVFKTDAEGRIRFDAAHLVSGTLFKDSNGNVVGLPGTYRFEETQTPAGFLACEPWIETVEPGKLSSQGGSQLNSKAVTDDNAGGYAVFTKEIEDQEPLCDLLPEVYTTDGTEITVYYAGTSVVAKDLNGNQVILTVTDGTTKTVKLAVGEYEAVETKAPEHFALDPSRHAFTVSESNTELSPAKVKLEDKPLFDPLSLMLEKQNEDGEPLPGAIFEVEYYPFLAAVPEDLTGETPVRCWEFTSDDQGNILYDEDHLTGGDPLFMTVDGKLVGLTGSYLFTEKQAPKGYVPADPFVKVIDPDAASFGKETVFDTAKISDIPQKILLHVEKVDAVTGLKEPAQWASFEGAEFEVTALDPSSGEKVVIEHLVTDENGEAEMEIPNPLAASGAVYETYYVKETKASPGCVVNETVFEFSAVPDEMNIPVIRRDIMVEEEHTFVSLFKTGFSDSGEVVSLKGASLQLLSQEGEVLDEWVSDGEDRTYEGLPAGEYTVVETETPEGFMPLQSPITITVSAVSEEQRFEIYNEKEPVIHTTAAFSTGDKMYPGSDTWEDGKAEIVDEVEMDYLTEGENYRLQASLIDLQTEEVIAEGELDFAAEGGKQTEAVIMTVNVESLAGHSLVVTEHLFELSRSDQEPVAEHSELTDEQQTVYVTKMGTHAADMTDEDPFILAEGEQTILDEVTYENLIPGEKYELKAYLMDKDTGEKIVGEKKEPVVAALSFTAEAKNGSVLMKIPVKAEWIMGKTTVVFEELFHDDHLIGIHADIRDEGQTVRAPWIRTTAKIEGEKTISETAGIVTVTDHVQFEGLKVGMEYEMTATLMDRETGEALPGQKTVVRFTPKEEDGSLEIAFQMDVSGLGGEKLVVFEDLSYVNEKGENIQIASHHDLDDKDQTVEVRTKVDTGDQLHLIMYISSMILSFSGMIFLTCQVAKKRRLD